MSSFSSFLKDTELTLKRRPLASITHQEVRFYTFPDGGHICFGGATGGLPRVTMIRLSGNNTPEGRAVVAGTLLINNIKYIKSTRQV